MRQIYRIEFLYLITELKKVEGQIFDNAYFSNGIYRLKFKTDSINFEPGKRINLARIIYPAGNPDRIVQKLKTLTGSRLLKVDLIDMDRVVKFEFEDWNLIIELYGKGNIIVGDMYTNYPSYKTIQYKKELWNYDNIEKYISLAFGKPYVDSLKNIVTGDIEKDVETIKKLLKPYWNGNDFRVIYSEGYQEVDELSYYIEKIFELKVTTSSRLKALLKSKQEILDNIEKIKAEIEENKKKGELILQNYDIVEQEIKKHDKNFYLDL
jgi:predicted ribosome quality control (RQC) complex YloA/Tae2 family protein